MKYILTFLLLVGCASAPPPTVTGPPGEYIEEVVIQEVIDNNSFITETDIRMCIQDPGSPWCVIECEQYVQVWCK